MRKVLKRILVVAVGLVVLVGALLATIPYFFGNALKARFEKAINQQITGTVHLKGDARFSLLTHFPNASMSFEQVLVMGGAPFANDTLLSAGRMALLFNPLSLLSGKYVVETVEIEDGMLSMYTDQQGRSNFDIWQTDTAGSSQDGVNIDLQRAHLYNFNISYGEDSRWAFYSIAHDVTLSGHYRSAALYAEVQGSLTVSKFKSNGVTYIDSLPVELLLAGDLLPDEGIYQLSPSILTIAHDAYHLKGRVEQQGEQWHVNFIAKGQDISLASLISMLPEDLSGTLQGIDSEGNLTFEANVEGPVSGAKAPLVTAMFSLHDGTLYHPDLPRALTDVVLEGSITNGGDKGWPASQFLVKDFEAYLGEYPMRGTLALQNVAEPEIDATIEAKINLADWQSLLARIGWYHAGGQLALEGVQIKGRWADMVAGRYNHRWQATGSLQMAEVKGTQDDQPWRVSNGRLTLRDDAITIDKVSLASGASDVMLHGNINAFWQQIDALLSGENAPPLQANIDVTGSRLVWEDISALLPAGASASTESHAESYLSYFKRAKGVVDVALDTLEVDDFSGTAAKGRFRLSPYMNRLDGIAIRTSGGLLQADGFLRVIENTLQLEGAIRGESLAIQSLFNGFDNFRQDFLVSENIEGTLDCSINGFMAWDSTLQYLTPLTDIEGELVITNGQLKKFEPLRQLSDFVQVRELEHIEFAELRNVIRVQGDQVVIPAMQIQSTAMNLWVAGKHTFDQKIDYQFKIDLLDVLGRKVRLRQMQLAEAKQRGEGPFNLYITMTGTVENPVFETNKGEVLKKFAASKETLDPRFINFDSWEEKPKPVQQPRHSRKDDLEYIDW